MHHEPATQAYESDVLQIHQHHPKKLLQPLSARFAALSSAICLLKGLVSCNRGVGASECDARRLAVAPDVEHALATHAPCAVCAYVTSGDRLADGTRNAAAAGACIDTEGALGANLVFGGLCSSARIACFRGHRSVTR